MSLVAYGSSDEDSSEENCTLPEKCATTTNIENSILNTGVSGGNRMNLVSNTFLSNLPTPKSTALKINDHEEDDEFLHKKAKSSEKPPPLVITKVKITIPSLKEFNDVEKDMTKSIKKASQTSTKSSGLLNILPMAKSEQNFSKSHVGTKPQVSLLNFTPDTVKFRRTAHNTEMDAKQNTGKKSQKPSTKIENGSDSDSEDDSNDYFSLSSKYEALPHVNGNEINALVAKRSAQISEASKKYFAEAVSTNDCADYSDLNTTESGNVRNEPLDEEAIKVLEGSRAKRKRKNEIQVVDISSANVLPDHNEWMRSTLATSTAYQPTGVLVDEEPAAGTRRKHQITYLAHKAKANEAELQAMWAANRQNRRATQSKYGF